MLGKPSESFEGLPKHRENGGPTILNGMPILTTPGEDTSCGQKLCHERAGTEKLHQQKKQEDGEQLGWRNTASEGQAVLGCNFVPCCLCFLEYGRFVLHCQYIIWHGGFVRQFLGSTV